MIGKLTGTAEEIYGQDSIILDVNGVGYIVYCSENTKKKLKFNIGGTTDINYSLFIEMQTKDDGVSLFGFYTNEEKQCFKCLNSVQGIGGKVAISILNQLNINDIISSVKNGNCNTFQRISGIGPKLAKRIVTELYNNKQLMNITTIKNVNSNNKDNEGDNLQDNLNLQNISQNKSENNNDRTNIDINNMEMQYKNSILEDAISAVVNLGFNKIRVTEIAENIIKEYNYKYNYGAISHTDNDNVVNNDKKNTTNEDIAEFIKKILIALN